MQLKNYACEGAVIYYQEGGVGRDGTTVHTRAYQQEINAAGPDSIQDYTDVIEC